jgi:hypothetical protein
VDRHVEYAARLERWRDRIDPRTLTGPQASGWACVACKRNWRFFPAASVPVGFSAVGQVFVCVTCDEREQDKRDG